MIFMIVMDRILIKVVFSVIGVLQSLAVIQVFQTDVVVTSSIIYFCYITFT